MGPGPLPGSCGGDRPGSHRPSGVGASCGRGCAAGSGGASPGYPPRGPRPSGYTPQAPRHRAGLAAGGGGARDPPGGWNLQFRPKSAARAAGGRVCLGNARAELRGGRGSGASPRAPVVFRGLLVQPPEAPPETQGPVRGAGSILIPRWLSPVAPQVLLLPQLGAFYLYF